MWQIIMGTLQIALVLLALALKIFIAYAGFCATFIFAKFLMVLGSNDKNPKQIFLEIIKDKKTYKLVGIFFAILAALEILILGATYLITLLFT